MKLYLMVKVHRRAGRRSPQGERGLKRGVTLHNRAANGRSPQGERGLKRQDEGREEERAACRSPQGERGLKRGNRAKNPRGLVAPRKGSVG